MSFVQWIEILFGVYQPVLTDVYLPLESVDPVTGSVYISSYEVQQVVASGMASWDLVYILQVVILVGFLIWVTKYLQLALHPQKIFK